CQFGSGLSFRYVSFCSFLFFFNATATTEIYTLSLHDALPICSSRCSFPHRGMWSSTWSPSCRSGTKSRQNWPTGWAPRRRPHPRSEEHTSELQSRSDLVCRLLLEKKNN